MKKILTILYVSAISSVFYAGVGHTTITFNDAARTGGFGSGGGAGRQIQTEVYYPAATSADNVPVVGANLPLIVFGHGFAMGWDAYDNVWTDFVAKGYIVCFPRTEGSLSPTHLEFGKDLALVASKMQLLNTVAATTTPAVSLFLSKLAPRTAIMGHSMGGGSSYLDHTYNGANITTIVTYAAAETSPTSSGAAPLITIPNLVITGVNDCVAPAATHQDLIYTALNSASKTQIYITGGGHCFFANSNLACSFGECTCSPNPTISRSEQQDVAQDHSTLWLDYYLKNICSKAQEFQDSLTTSTRTTFRQSAPLVCNNVGINELYDATLKIVPNPSSGVFQIPTMYVFQSWNLYNVDGRIIQSGKTTEINATEFPDGIYFLHIEMSDGSIQIAKLQLTK